MWHTFSATNSTAKNSKRKGKKHDEATNPPQYSATTKDLQKLAEVIASSAFTVPRSVLAIARRAIKLRRAVTSWFYRQGKSAGNESHAHFITALEQICETLEWKTNQSSKPGAKQSPEVPADEAEAEIFLNKFGVLTVEEPIDTGVQTQTTSAISKNIVKVNVVEDDENDATESRLSDLLFKILCLFRDLENMRKFISVTWSEYQEKKIDLMNAAVVTDSALQLGQNLIQDVENDWRSSGQSGDVQSIIYNLAVYNRGIDPTPSMEVGLPYSKHMADIADLFYVPTKTLLDSFADVLKNNPLPVFKKGHFGIYNPKANRERMSVAQKFNEDKIILLSILPDFCMVEMLRVEMKMPTEDVITRSLAEYSRTQKVTLGLSFAAQVLLDVHHATRRSSSDAFADLRMSGLRIQKTIDDYLQLSRTHPQPKFWPKEGDQEIRNISSLVKSWIIEDPLLDLHRQLKSPRTPVKHALFSQHATLCGLILFSLNSRMQVTGQQLVSQWYDVQQLAFLQNLVMKAPAHKDLKWPDMDAFIKIHGESHIFIGSRPKNAEESINRLELATGISSATNFARNSRTKDFHKPDGKNARVLMPTTAVANLFFARYVGGSEEDVGIFHIDRVLDQLSQKSKLESSSKEVQKANPELNLARKWSNSHNIDTLQLLAFLKTKLFEEEPVLMYNYFGMHKRSIELLRRIRDKEHQKFVQYFTSAYMPDESFISNIVILIHHVARGSARDARKMGLKLDKDTELVSRIVMSAGELMGEYLVKNGDVACKELRVFCKNKKPIQDDVAHDDGKSEKLVGSWLSLEDVLGPKGMASLMTGIPIA
ncbi:unnamed protein product [Penicillium salamii]|uniref:DUF6604 domain-containing protein n=1 Tax=Penicillium salamii TaxID=1612424 RepID=A0A9W4IC13_9EURO|nr:unnamed protein product [Penicillium salamii]CAG7960181.1 unnamed protein product [Penicillium salamii]CAG7963796.1 unnamed protein product [Penicillium salamii]CAG7981549.1 unnamed protein product [Penicillium salamii]CAG8258640.1 unnamed protein product [Penicillium salamii]